MCNLFIILPSTQQQKDLNVTAEPPELSVVQREDLIDSTSTIIRSFESQTSSKCQKLEEKFEKDTPKFWIRIHWSRKD